MKRPSSVVDSLDSIGHVPSLEFLEIHQNLMIIARSFLSNHVESDHCDLFCGCRNQWHLCIRNIQIMQIYQIWSCTNLESTAESGPECHPGREELNPTAFEVESERKVCFLSFFLASRCFQIFADRPRVCSSQCGLPRHQTWGTVLKQL